MKRILILGMFGAGGCTGVVGPSGGGNPPPTGVPVICVGEFVNTVTGERRPFPCDRTGDTCVASTDPQAESCGVDFEVVEGEMRTVVPGFDRANIGDGFCACRDPDVPPAQQSGSCQTVCQEVALKTLNANDPNGPWTCENVTEPANGVKSGFICTHGSVVFLNGGPAEYLVRLAGTQQSSGSVDLGVTTVSRSATSNVEGWMTFTTGDRSRGCGESGCPMIVNRLGLKVDPFHIDGFSVEVFGYTVFSFGGVTLEDAGVVNQGFVEGRVFDDGTFALSPGNARLVGMVDMGATNFLNAPVAQTITGRVDFATGDIVFDPFSMPGNDGQMTITGLAGTPAAGPPVATIATPSVVECAGPQGTGVTLDATGTTEPDGEAVSFAWTVNGAPAGTGAQRIAFLPLGVNDVQLTATDARLSVGRATKNVTVRDTTAPGFVNPGRADLTSCDPVADRLPLVPPQVTDACTGITSLQAFLVTQNGAPVSPPRVLDAGAAQLAAGEHVIQWIARDGAGNQSSLNQIVRVGPAVQATDHFELRDRVLVVNGRGIEAGVGSTGSGTSQIGVQARLGEILSVGPIFMQNFARVTGRAASAGAITLQQGASAGVLQPNTPVNLGQIAWLQPVAGTAFGGADVVVPPDTIAPPFTTTSFGRLQVMSRSRATIPANTTIRELWLEPDATLVVQGASPRIVVRDRWIHRGRVAGAQAGSRGQVFVLGDELRLEKPVQGLGLIAPNARVTITTMANNTKLSVLAGKIVEVQPDVRLVCDRAASLPSP
jgi:hypothetical protein